MTDGVPKATGNAYLAKASLPATYADFKAAIEAGTQGLDLNFNSAGWAVIGTLLSKAELLPDTVRDALGLTGDASVADALGTIVGRAKLEVGSYVGTGTYGESNPNSITFQFAPKLFCIYAYQNPSWNYIKSISEESTSVQNILIPMSFLTETYAAYKQPSQDSSGGGSAYGEKSSDGKMVLWYHANSAIYQNNITGFTYYYFAIG